jgi:hypothetical protein
VSERGTYVEAILVYAQEGGDPAVERWLAEHGLPTNRMRAGLLVWGDVRAFEAAFGVDIALGGRPVSLPVPLELAQAVESITIPPPPRVHT